MNLRHGFLVFCALFGACATASPLRSQDYVEKKHHVKFFADRVSGRVVMEGPGDRQTVLLLGMRYALSGENFLSFPEAPLLKDGKVFIPDSVLSELFPSPGHKAPLVPPPPAPPPPVAIAEKAAGECRKAVRVFLDPGHGGEDHGTVKDKTKEKDIVLSVAKLLADILRKQGMAVNFSRTKDVFLPLDIRSKLAEEWKADLFISLHVNSSPLPQAHGTETYILSQDATDAEARKLALIENSIVMKAQEKQSAVQDILWDMEQTSYLQESAYLASYIQEALVKKAARSIKESKSKADWKNRGVRQAPFFVLNRAAMPAVLVELGYLSNTQDRKLLLQKNFQTSLANGLAEGIMKYNCK